MRKLSLLMALLLLTVVPVLAQAEATAFVRAAHFVPDAPALDVLVNGERSLNTLDFADISDWLEVPAGIYSFDVVPQGSDAEEALLSESFSLNDGDWVTIPIIGEVATASLAFQPLIEQLTTIPDGLVRVGLLHANATFPPINVSDNNGRDLVFGLGYPGTFVGSDGYSAVDITAGSYTLTMTDDNRAEIATVGPTILGAGRYYLYAVIGTAETPSFVFNVTDVKALETGSDIPITEADTGSGLLFMRLAHLVSDAPEVDIYLNQQLAVSNLSFTNITDFIAVNAGIYDVALVPAGETLDKALYSTQLALFEQSMTLIAAVGYIEDDTLKMVAVRENNEATGVGQARIAFFQTIPTNNLFNLMMDDNPLLTGIAFPEIFTGAGDGYVSTDILAGQYNFGIEAPDENITLDAGNVTLGAGRYYLFVAVGSPLAPSYLLIPTNIPG